MIISLAFFMVAVGVAIVGLRFPVLPAVLYVWFDLFPIQLVFPGAITWFSLGNLLGFSLLLGMLFQGDLGRFKVTQSLFWMSVYLVWITFTTINSVHAEAAWAKWDHTSKAIISTLVIVPLLATRERIEAFLWAIVLPTAFLGVRGAVALVQSGGAGVDGGASSLTGGPVDRNFVAARLVAVVPLVFFLRAHGVLVQRTPLYRAATAVLLATMVVSVIATYSRGGLIGLLAISIGGAMLSAHPIRSVFGILVACAFGLLLAPGSWMERMDTLRDYQSDRSATGRLDAWAFAWEYALSHPLTGGGFAIFFSYFTPGGINRDFHSFLFETMAEQGFVGLGIYALLVLSAVVSLRRARKRASGVASEWVGPLATAVLIGVSGMYASGLFINFANQSLVFYVFGLASSIGVFVSRQSGPQRQPDGGPDGSLARHRASARVTGGSGGPNIRARAALP